MGKKYLFLLLILSWNKSSSAHLQHIHQYIVKEAYELLKLQFGEIPAVRDHIGGTESFFAGEYGWQRGFVTTGAWREDEEDVVFNYDQIYLPIAGLNYALVSITHFWDADNGDLIKNKFVIRKEHFPDTSIGSWENSYDKFMRYANGNWIIWFPEIIECKNLSNDHKLIITPKITQLQIFGIPVCYNGLTDFYKDSKLKFHSDINSNIEIIDISVFPPKLIEPQEISFIEVISEVKNKIVWEIIGRMCHLLADLSVPAHTHLDEHGLLIDSYEHWMGDSTEPFTVWNGSNSGTFIDPYTNDNNSLHFLMYTMQQQADHFGSNGPGFVGNGNDIIGGDGLPDELAFLSNLNLNTYGEPLTSVGPWDISYLENIRDKTFPYAIRATAGLLYWFSTETGILTGIDEENLISFSDFHLSQNYPNPFNPATNFEFRLPAEAFAKAGIADRGFVSLKVFDLLGNEVATIVNEELSAGSYKYPWNASGLASGVYFYKLQAGNFSDVKKLILMK